MRLIRSMVATLIIVGLLTALAGCSSTPVTMAEIPVLTEASPMATGDNTFADSIASSLESSLSERGTVELHLYSVPNSVSWDTIDSFYTTSLAESDWKAANELRQESEVMNTTGWTRGGLASEQGLMVGYAPDTLGQGAFLIVALFSE
jgi:hypothetical protein